MPRKITPEEFRKIFKERYPNYELLSDDGVIFVSLDDNMQAYFKVMMDNIFGEENFICDLR